MLAVLGAFAWFSNLDAFFTFIEENRLLNAALDFVLEYPLGCAIAVVTVTFFRWLIVGKHVAGLEREARSKRTKPKKKGKNVGRVRR